MGLVFGLALFAAVLVSARASRGALSTAVLFLGVGIVAGAANVVASPSHDQVRFVAELALVATLFTDGGKLDVRTLISSFGMPVRALVVGLPLNLVITALLARSILDLSWGASFLVGAALSPTDPIFASSLIGNDHVPKRLRSLLHVESGLNDGIALPIVLAVLGSLGEATPSIIVLVGRVFLGVAIGIVIPLVAVWLYRRPIFGASKPYKPVFALAVVIVTWSLARRTQGNEYLAAFAAGAVMSAASEEARGHWEAPGELLSEMLKLAALLLFGLQIAHASLFDFGLAGIAFAIAIVCLARPLSMAVALVQSSLPRRERAVAAWFGPRGFASVVFGLLVHGSRIPEANVVFQAVALAVVASIGLHATTDTLISKWLAREARSGSPVHT